MWSSKLTIQKLNLAGKRVLMRLDFNVPMYDGKINNNKKIVAGLDSIVYALVKEAKSVVIMAHLGNPHGMPNMRYSLAPIAEELNSLLQKAREDPKSLGKYSQIFKLYSGSDKFPKHVKFLSSCVGLEVEEVCINAPEGSIFLLENLKFHMEEEGFGVDTSGNKLFTSVEANRNFRKSLHALGDLYVNDAFSLSHTSYSSILGDGFYKRAAGLQFNKEIQFFEKLLYKPKRPFLAILGGINIVSKLQMIENLLDKVNEVIIAGAMAFPFLTKLKRMHVGHSVFDVEGFKIVKKIMKKARNKNVEIHFPVDFVSGGRSGAVTLGTVGSGIEDGYMGLDIGPESCSVFRRVILRSKMIVWNGPPGAYELDGFRTGTESVLLDVVKATSGGATSILVGEDTACCASRWNQEDNVSHVSSGPDAAKELLKGNILPGLSALSNDYSVDLPDQENKNNL